MHFLHKLGKNAPANLDRFKEIKYYESSYSGFKAYAKSIKTGELSALADFELYQKFSEDIETLIVGTSTSNGIEIKGKSNHFIARVIGSVSQRRNGVEISDVIDALKNSVKVDAVATNQNGRSQRFIGNRAAVTVDPDTGILIQTNSIKKKENSHENNISTKRIIDW